MEKPVYTHRQVCELIAITRSWTLNNPRGALPYLPVIWEDSVSKEDNEKASKETMPPYRKPHKLIQFLMWLRIL